MFQLWRNCFLKQSGKTVRRGSEARIRLETLEDRVNPVLFYSTDLAIVQSVNPTTSVAPGQNAAFILTVTNNGPVGVASLNVVDSAPASLQNLTYTPSSGIYTPSTGKWTLSSPLASGSSITLTLSGVVAANATQSLVNVAQVSTPGGVFDPNLLNNTTPPAIIPINHNVADLGVTLTNNTTGNTAAPGTSVTYTLTVQNHGPSAVTGANVLATLPTGLNNVSWTATASTGSSVPASGSGNINTSVNLLNGGTATFLITGTIDPSAVGTIVSTASVTAPAGFFDAPGNNTASNTITLASQADLSITKTHDAQFNAIDAGGQVVYTIVVGNQGPSAVTGATVVDTIPAGLSGFSWTAVASSGASVAAPSGTGAIDTQVSLLPNATVTFTLTASAQSTFSGQVDNIATVVLPMGVTDSNLGNNVATDSILVVGQADLSITKTDNTGGSSASGATVVYTIVVSNSASSPFAVAGASVLDQMPAELTNVSWTATPDANSSVAAASGTGNINTTVDLGVGASVTFTVTGTVASGLTPGAVVANSASVFVPSDRDDTNPTNNLAVDTFAIQPGGDLSLSSSDDTGGQPIPAGTPIVYTITVSNTGGDAVTDASFADALPAGVSSFDWTAVASSGASVASSSGTGSIDTTLSLAPGGTVTFTVNATPSPTFTGVVNNVATVAPPAGFTDINPANNSATDSTLIQGTSDLAANVVDSTGGFTTAGSTVTYTITVSNNGPDAVTAATVTDQMPAELTNVFWTATPDANSSVAAASGTGNINTTVDLAKGATVTFNVTATIASNAPADTTVVNNAVTVSVPTNNVDPNLLNNTASTFFTLTPRGDLSVAITDNTGGNPVVAGNPIVYTITVTNTGVDTAVDAELTNFIPTGLTGFTWTATAPAGSSVPDSGTGDIDALMTLLPGNSAIFTVTATTSPTFTGTVNNSATVNAPADFTDINPSNNTAADSVFITM